MGSKTKGILKKDNEYYISNIDVKGGIIKRKKNKKYNVKLRTDLNKQYPIPANQLIGLPYDYKRHLETILDQVKERIKDKIEKNKNYYFQEFSKEDFDKLFFPEKNIYSILNRLSEKDIEKIYKEINLFVENLRDEERRKRDILPIENAQYEILLDIVNKLDDKIIEKYEYEPIRSISDIKHFLTQHYKSKSKISKLFSTLNIFKTSALNSNEIHELTLELLNELDYAKYIKPLSGFASDKSIQKLIEAELKTEIEENLREYEETKAKLEHAIEVEKLKRDEERLIEEERVKEEQRLKEEEELNKKKPKKIEIKLKKKDIESGSGLFDSLKKFGKNVANVFTNSSSPSLDRVEKAYYPLIITRIQIYRTPVQDVPLTLLKAISLGNFDYKSNFDKLYHLYCVLELANETKTGFLYQLTEKTPNIVWEDRKDLLSMATGAEQMIYTVPSTTIVRFGPMIEQLKKNMGKTLTEYTASQYNCQDYILNILKATAQLANDKLPSNIMNFIYQDISKVLAPTSTTSKIANKVTDLSHVLNRIGHVVGIGSGIDDDLNLSNKERSKIDRLILNKLKH